MSGRVFISRRIPPAGVALLEQAGCAVAIGQEMDEEPVPREMLLTGAGGCDVLVPLLTEPVDREVLAANPDLLGVAQMAVGYDNVDVAAATELGIPVANTPGVLTEATADCAWALLMAVARRIPEAQAYMQSGRFRLWGPNLLLGADVGLGPDGRRKVLGIVGFGRIGRAVARRAAGFDMQVLAWSRTREQVDADPLANWAELPELLRSSDFVSVHTPLTADTHHLIGEEELRAMRSTSYLINTARGPVVDEAALVRALREGWIAGAGLDVFEREPEMAEGLADCPNAVLLPHIASATHDTRNRMAVMAAENALAHLAGARAPNAVNPEVYDTAAYHRRTGAR